MVNREERDLRFKVVYGGPEQAGKTTNLRELHKLVHPGHRGEVLTLTGMESTLFCDLLPLHFTTGDLRVHVQLFTLPGGLAHRMTRRAVLRGADGVVFVASAEPSQAVANRFLFDELVEHFEAIGGGQRMPPLCTQFNKQDLAGPTRMKPFRDELVIDAIATQGQGVSETWLGIMEAVWARSLQDPELKEALGMSAAEFRATAEVIFESDA